MANNSEGPSQTILVVDDDAMIRRGITAMLMSNGYSVVEAHDGQHALEVLATIGTVAMVLTDIFMPRMSGRDLIKNLPPDLSPAVIYMSGYADAGGYLRDGSAIQAEFIAKPFDPDDLIAKVKSILDRPAMKGEE